MKKEFKRKTIGGICALIVIGMFLAIALSPPALAGTSSDFWTMEGNSNTDAGDYLGTNDNFPLKLYTYGGERMRITTDGRVGINDDTPDFKLEVAGSSGSGYLGISSVANNDGDIFIIDSSGKVGIGYASPVAGLDVRLGVGGGSAKGVNFEQTLTASNYDDVLTAFYIKPTYDDGIYTGVKHCALDVELDHYDGGAATIGHYLNSATGDFAVAMGEGTTASGLASIAMGGHTTASGPYSFAVGGLDTEANNEFTIAIGLMAVASGWGSVAIGYDAEASGGLSRAIGTFVTASANNAFVIGRGVTLSYDHLVNNIPSSLMVGFDSTEPTLFVDGSSVGIWTTSPGRKLDVQDSTNPQIRLTHSDAFYTDLQTTSSGYLYINPSGGRVGIGTASPGAALDVEVSSGGAATIGNYQCSATGDCAIAMGYGTTAIGEYSTAMGWRTTAIGDYSTAMGGWDTEASGEGSIAIGFMAKASGFVSQAIGMDVEASGVYSCAIGSWVTAGPAYSTYVIGRGADAYNPLVNNIEKSFMVGFDSTTPTLFVDGSSVGIGTTSPNELLEVDGRVRANTCFNHNGNNGITQVVVITDNFNVEHTMTFSGGILTGYSTA